MAASPTPFVSVPLCNLLFVCLISIPNIKFLISQDFPSSINFDCPSGSKSGRLTRPRPAEPSQASTFSTVPSRSIYMYMYNVLALLIIYPRTKCGKCIETKQKQKHRKEGTECLPNPLKKYLNLIFLQIPLKLT